MLRSIIVIAACVLTEQFGRYAFSDITVITHNPGAAFGLLGNAPGFALLLSGVAFALIVGAVVFGKLKPSTRLGLAIMAGGALSNLLERIFIGHVLDWIPVPFMDLYFNLADVEISIGALIAFLSCV